MKTTEYQKNTILRRFAAFALALLLAALTAPPCFAAGETAGDADGDGAVSAGDARLVLRAAVGLTLVPDEIFPFADANGDGQLQAEDARLVLRAAVGLEKKSALSTFSAPTHYQGSEIPWANKTLVREVTLTEKKTLALGEEHLRRSGTQYKWSSSNTAAATVSADGTVRGVKKGFACVSLINGGNRYYYYITVRTPLQEKIYALQEKYPDGYYWNGHEKSARYPAVSEIPCSDHESGGYKYCIGQCAGFATLLSNEVFGKAAPETVITENSKIKIGDYLRMLPSHSVFVIDRVEEGAVDGYNLYADENETAGVTYLTFAECNWDWHCGINWGRTVALDNVRLDLNNQWFDSYTRY